MVVNANAEVAAWLHRRCEGQVALAKEPPGLGVVVEGAQGRAQWLVPRPARARVVEVCDRRRSGSTSGIFVRCRGCCVGRQQYCQERGPIRIARASRSRTLPHTSCFIH